MHVVACRCIRCGVKRVKFLAKLLPNAPANLEHLAMPSIDKDKWHRHPWEEQRPSVG